MVRAEQFYWGKFIDGHTPRGDFRILAASSGLTLAEADLCLSAVYLGSHERTSLEHLTHGYSFAPLDDGMRCVFAHVRPSRVADRGHLYPVYHGLVLPIAALSALRLRTLVEAAGIDPLAPEFAELRTDLPTLDLPDSTDAMSEAQGILERLRVYDGAQAALLLNALLSGEYAVLSENVPAEPTLRVAFIEALWDLLPHTHRHWLSFCTEVFDGVSTAFKLKCLYRGAGGRTARDLLLNYDTLELHPLPKASNHYVPLAVRWLIAPESPKMRLAFETILKQITNAYAVMLPEEQLHVAAAVYGVLHPATPQSIPADLLATALRYRTLIPEKEQQRLALKLFDAGLAPGQSALWDPLLTGDWLTAFAAPLLMHIQELPDLRPLVAGLREWLLVEDVAAGLALLKLIGTPSMPLVSAFAADAELLLRVVELYFENSGQQELIALLNVLPESNLEPVFRCIRKTIRRRPQIRFALEVMRDSTLTLSHKKAFYFQLIELAVRVGRYADEIGMELLDQAAGFALTYDEKVRLLALNLPLTYRNQLLRELTMALLDAHSEQDNTGELARLLTAYTAAAPRIEVEQVLLGGQSARQFALLSGQVGDYLARLDAFAKLDANGQDAVNEVQRLFAGLSVEEHTDLLRALGALRDLLEPKGRLARTIPSSAALKRLLDILSGG